ncbi:Rv1733c family protein [Streptomyces sp. bgisy153]|uniref:Rv1733c family protein n=1 Tax=Streptomyces sp. bgisy153 TaxID=3413793 RepID=UPI003D7336BC
MRAIGGLRRWRHNPLCRTTDLVEAWTALTALLLILLLTPVAGVLTGKAAYAALQRSVREQHASRHEVAATVVRRTAESPFRADPDGGSGRGTRTRVLAEWSAPDGTLRRQPVLTGIARPRAGDRFRIWTDRQGRVAARPLDSATATVHAVLAGFGAALLAAGAGEAARRTVVRCLMRRRYERWDQAWERAGPDWGRTGAGS